MWEGGPTSSRSGAAGRRADGRIKPSQPAKQCSNKCRNVGKAHFPTAGGRHAERRALMHLQNKTSTCLAPFFSSSSSFQSSGFRRNSLTFWEMYTHSAWVPDKKMNINVCSCLVCFFLGGGWGAGRVQRQVCCSCPASCFERWTLVGILQEKKKERRACD